MRALPCVAWCLLFAACQNGPSTPKPQSSGTSTQSSGKLDSVDFTIPTGATTSNAPTTTAPKLSCEQKAQGFALALDKAWPIAHEVGGMVLAVRTRSCSPFAEARGNAAPGVAMTPEHVLGAGDISKVMVSSAIMAAKEEGLFQLDDPVSTYIPGLSDPSLTIRSLLDRTSGLADYNKDSSLVNQVKANPTQPVSAQSLVDAVKGQPIQTVPNREQFLPGHSNAAALELVCQVATKGSCTDYLKRKILDPMAISDLYLWDNTQDPEKLALGVTQQNGMSLRRDNVVPVSFLGAAAGLRASAPALAAWLETLAGPMTPLDPSSVALMMRRTVFDSVAPQQHGMGLKIWQLLMGVDAVGADGNAPGYSAIAMTVPAYGVTIVAMTNDQSARLALDQLFEETLRLAMPPETSALTLTLSNKDQPLFLP